jgi:hypothetical protein
MSVFQVVFRTQGVATSFVNTTKSVPVFLSGSQATCFLNVYAPTSVFLTNSVKEAFVTTNSNVSLFLTPPQKVAFFDTADKNTAKLLKLRLGELEVASNYTNVLVTDATGNYNALTNQGGYNVLPAPYNAARPYRNNVALWTLYRIWNVYKDVTQSPDSQDEQFEADYEYQLFFPTELNANNELQVIKGIYEIILIAAPYFDETNTGGTFDSSGGATPYYIVYGDETNFDSSLNDTFYLYYVNPTNGNLVEVGVVLKVFSDTALALTAPATNEPDAGAKMYGSAAAVTTTINSGGTVASYTNSSYNVITGTATQFITQFAFDEYLYYIDAATGDYVEMGQILQVDTDTTLKLHNKTLNANPTGGEILMSSLSQFVLTNSGGTYDSDSGNNIFGVNTLFTNFVAGQTLYYQDSNGNISEIGVIQTIVSDTELVLAGTPLIIPDVGDRLFAGDAGVILVNSNGTFDSIGFPPLAYYVLTGDGANFSGFVGKYVYIVGENLLYQELGVADFQRTSNELIFYTPIGLIVNEGDFVIANPTQLAINDVEGVVDEYATGDYYNLQGVGTTFLTTANPNQYLFYLDNASQLYKYVGQIFQVFDNTNLWMFNATQGAPDNTTTLFTSDTLNTETVPYNSVRGLASLYDMGVEFPSWFVTSTGLLVDEDVINCLSRMRYEFLESVMCGNCNEGYLETYSVYIGMLNAMEVGKWDVAVEFYNKLKVICTEYHNSCGC